MSRSETRSGRLFETKEDKRARRKKYEAERQEVYQRYWNAENLAAELPEPWKSRGFFLATETFLNECADLHRRLGP